MKNWYYNKIDVKSIKDVPEGAIGFVYAIMNLNTGTFYIGKKSFYSSRKAKIGVREKAASKTRKRFKKVVKESKWLTYMGSSEDLKADIEKHGSDNFARVILEYAFNKKYLGYAEVKHQIVHDVLNNDTYNHNIMGKYYRKDMLNEPIIKKEE